MVSGFNTTSAAASSSGVVTLNPPDPGGNPPNHPSPQATATFPAKLTLQQAQKMGLLSPTKNILNSPTKVSYLAHQTFFSNFFALVLPSS